MNLWIDQFHQDIVITMPDGSERKGTSWSTSPMDVAKEVSKSLSERVVIAKVRFCLHNGGESFMCHRLTVSSGTWKGRSRDLAGLSYWTLNTQKVRSGFYTCHSIHISLFYRQKGILALICTRSWRVCRATLRVSLVYRTSDRRWIFL
jgi:hypothetical protein